MIQSSASAVGLSKYRGSLMSFIKKIIFFSLLIGGWQVVCIFGVWPDYLLPTPASVGKTLLNGFTDGSYLLAIGISLKRLAFGFGISLIFGTAMGFALARFRLLEETVGSVVLGLQTLPSICWLPLALLWFGLNENAILFVTVMGAILSITISTDHGIRQIPPIYIRAGKNLGATGYKLLLHVIFPSALPALTMGMRQGWSFAWRSLMAGELLFINLGLGQLLMMGRELNDMAQVISVMVIIIIIGVIFDRFIFGKLERTIAERWGLKAVE